MHYTSVPNIMKVIGPLFLDGLKNELESSRGNRKKMFSLLSRISKIKFFDPACGSGNFLIISYKELRRLEVQIIKELGIFAFPGISMSQFYGIEIDDFAHEIAKLSLYLAEHQMNLEFELEFGKPNPTLPLKTGGNIFRGNAARLDWGEICSTNNSEVFIFGNPPYLGARQQNKDQKKDMEIACHSIHGFNNLDYISCWFLKAAQYIRGNTAKFAFVSTNSICQGSQVLLWPNILNTDLEIYFAHQSFKWVNNAKKNAGVICVIIGVRNNSAEKKIIFNGRLEQEVRNINAYLADFENITIEGRRAPISDIPPINYGSFALDDGNFTLSLTESKNIIDSDRRAARFIVPFVGAKELINGQNRYCIWIEKNQLSEAEDILPIKQRIDRVKKWRLKSERQVTKKLALTPHMFAEIRQPNNNYLAFPTVSSERRNYIPIRFFDADTIASNQIYTISTSQPWVFGILSSKIHTVWVRAVAGRLKTDLRYSSALCYNTFPIPNLTESQKEDINRYVYDILEERERHSEKTLADMYDPELMPDGLLEAHKRLDQVIERCYRLKPFQSDEERLEYLFRLYQQMKISEQS